MSNLSSVQEIYAAFGRGDIPAILEHLSESVDWEYGGLDEVPWLRPRRGRDGAAEFFESLGAVEIHSFTPKTLLEEENIVVGLVDIELTVKKTGKRVSEEDEVHIWRFDDEGKVARFRHRGDTYRHFMALKE